MRTIINISLPAKLKKEVELAVREGEYTTTSEFFRSLLRSWKEQQAALRALRRSQRDIQTGRGRILRSLKDLR